MQKSLVAFDTDHIKEYVFGTDRLKEIRGASSLLDHLNRQEMVNIAREYGVEKKAIIYTNGGSGLFVVDKEKAKDFGERVKRMYRKMSGGTASVTVAIQDLPEGLTLSELKERDLEHELKLLTYQIVEEKGSPQPVFALPSHPFMRHCSLCGVEYAEEESLEAEEAGTFYCASCREKRKEDSDVKESIPDTIRHLRFSNERVEKYLWDRVLWLLKQEHYDLSSPGLDRPDDFNEFRQFARAKEYIGLIYADANNMGKAVEKLHKLHEREIFATGIDDAIHQAMARAIKQHLPVVTITRKKEGQRPVFPFDILLVGGDDIVMVTDAAKALDVSLTIAQEFYGLANNETISQLTNSKLSLSIGVVLAPVKYPFGLLQDMAESALKFAKQAAADDRAKAADQKQFDGSRINFLVVTGGSKPDFKLIYNYVYRRTDKEKSLEFHASLRPYKPEDLERLLGSIREGRKLRLGRTKLHQLREAVLDKNLTTSVQKGLATWHNWRSEKQRGYVTGLVYEYAARRQAARANVNDPASLFPRVTFPWFADGKNKERDVYRTSLLDFIELYDFIAREGEDNGDEA